MAHSQLSDFDSPKSSNSSYQKNSSIICCLPGCSNTELSPNIQLLKVPNGKYTGRYGSSADVKKWSDNFCNILFKYRDQNDNKLKERIEKGVVWICSIHFDLDNVCKTNKRTWLQFGALPKHFMPVKSHDNVAKPMRRHLMKMEVPLPAKLSKCGYADISEVETAYSCLSSAKSLWQMSVFLQDGRKSLHFTSWNRGQAEIGVPLFSCFIQSNLDISISLLGIPLPSNHCLYKLKLHGPNSTTLHSLLSAIFQHKRCCGFDDICVLQTHWTALVIPELHKNVGEFKTRYVSPHCSVAIKGSTEQCLQCIHQYSLYATAQERRDATKKLPLVKITNPSNERIKSTALQQQRRIKQLQDELRCNGITITDAVQDVVDNITNREYCNSELLRDWRVVQNQMTLHQGKRYPSSVVKYCLRLYAKSPAAYNLLKEVLILPSPSTLRREKNKAGAVQPGVQSDLLNRLSAAADTAVSPHQRKVAVLMDEMTIKESIVYRSYTNDVVGFSENGDVADHMLAFYVRGITNPKLDGVVAYFPTKSLKYAEVFTMIMDVVMEIEMKSAAQVCAIIGDGLGANITTFSVLGLQEDGEPKFRMRNPIDTSRFIYFIQDPPHLLKSVRNNLMNPLRNLWNGEYMQWKHIQEIIETDLKRGELRFFPKLKMQHANPNTWEKMNVNIAAQTLSRTVGSELRRNGKDHLGNFVIMLDKWFDLMNTSTHNSRRRANSNLLPYKLNDEETENRLAWLGNDFLNYFTEWRSRVMSRKLPDGVGRNDRSSMLLSSVTHNGLVMTTRSIIYLINECLQDGADHVCTRRINQDPLENHFGHQRQRGRYCDAPTALGFAYNVRAINTLRSPVAGSNILTS